MKINVTFVEKVLISFIRSELSKLGYSKGIIGLSGGLDSSVCAFLAVGALGKEHVIGLIMPYGKAFDKDAQDAREVADTLGIKTHTIDIAPMVDAYYERYPSENLLSKGNKMARERMSILYDFSQREHALILGTSNKTELFLGYGTIHGDMACAINPMGDLYKTQVRQLALHLGVPEKIIRKSPTAGLWPGQTDEKELGMTYEKMDNILFQMIDLRKPKAELLAAGLDEPELEKIMLLIKKSEFKRKLPPIAKISDRTVGLDYLYPFDRDK